MQPQSDTTGRQASVDRIDCHDAMGSAAAGSLGRDWKEATLSKLRAFFDDAFYWQETRVLT